MASYFPHERLTCYQLAVDVASWIAQTPFPENQTFLHKQALQAVQSVVLNIAEGCSRGGASGKNHFRIARGSAAESCAVLDLLIVPGAKEQQDKLRQISAMLSKLLLISKQ